MEARSRPGRILIHALSVLLLAAFPASTHAQLTPGLSDFIPGLPRVWLGVGPAVTTGGQVDTGLGLLAQGTLQRWQHHLALRGVWATEVGGSQGGNDDGSVFEIGLLYGRTRIGRWTHTALSTGLAYVWLERCVEGGGSCATVGLPLAAEAAVQAFSTGLGIQLFANLNSESSYAGAALFLQLGWMP